LGRTLAATACTLMLEVFVLPLLPVPELPPSPAGPAALSLDRPCSASTPPAPSAAARIATRMYTTMRPAPVGPSGGWAPGGLPYPPPGGGCQGPDQPPCPLEGRIQVPCGVSPCGDWPSAWP